MKQAQAEKINEINEVLREAGSKHRIKFREGQIVIVENTVLEVQSVKHKIKVSDAF